MGRLLLLIAILCFAVHTCNQRIAPESAEGRPLNRPDPSAGARGACKLFIERRQLETANAIWGDISEWTVVSNDDGSVSVGARYAVGDRTRYTTCVMRREGSDWRLQQLSRLQ